MSGIFGIIHLDGRPVQAADMERMRDQMAHRGPDGSDIRLDGPVGLGQLMLHSTPESLHEALPWKDPESGLVITADARIDNRDELLRKLDDSPGRPHGGLLQTELTVGGRHAGDPPKSIPTVGGRHAGDPPKSIPTVGGRHAGAPPKSIPTVGGRHAGAPPESIQTVGGRHAGDPPKSALAVGGRHAGDPASNSIPDSQLILAAYKRWGEACVDHLLGDFAFAIWDGRKKRLFCARDYLGKRPFYYYHRDDLFVFASSALGVVAADEVPKRISETRIADYLLYELQGFDKTGTWFEDVWRLPPAHLATLSAQGFPMRQYWQADTETELRLASDEEYTDAFEEVFTTAVRASMRSHKPPASMLSGGLDSSTIAAIARDLQQGSGAPLSTFSGVSEDPTECNEARFSRMVIEQGGLNAAILRPSDVARFEERLAEVDGRMEDPFGALWIMHKMIYLSAAEQGHVAVMDGIDGDGVASLTSNYPVFLIREGRWKTANHEILGMRRNFHHGGYPVWQDYRGVLRQVLVPDFARKLKRKLLKPDAGGIPEDCFLRPDVADRLDVLQKREEYRKNCDVLGCGTLRQAHAARMNVAFVTAGIERYGRLAACCGVEQREPLLDRGLLEFCISLPWQHKVRDGWSKYGMRLLAQKFLPAEVAWRPGRDQIMWKFWMAWGKLNEDRNTGMLMENLPELENFLDRKKVMESLKRYKMGDIGAQEAILSLVCLVGWLQRNQ